MLEWICLFCLSYGIKKPFVKLQGRANYHRIHYLAFVANLTYFAVCWWSTRVPSPGVQHGQLCSRAFRVLRGLTPPRALQSAFLGQSSPLAVIIHEVFPFLSKLNCRTPGTISSPAFTLWVFWRICFEFGCGHPGADFVAWVPLICTLTSIPAVSVS